MHLEQVEIYSDKTNHAVLRHPGRKFPGALIQGDNLYTLCRSADEVCAKGKNTLDVEAYSELNKLRNTLWAHLTHYKDVLGEHGMPLPFDDGP